MSYDFGKMKKDQKALEANPTLMLLLIGPPGGGKSYAAGTTGLDTLFLHGGTERHGADSIKLGCFKKDVGTITTQSWAGKNADESYKNLVSVLTDPTLPEHFGAVVLDGLKDLTFDLISGTTMWRDFCLTDKGKHDKWREGAAIAHLMQPIMTGLFALRAAKVHTITTMVLDVQDLGSTGEVLLGKPLMPTYGVAAALIPQFDDRVVVSYAAPVVKGVEKPDHYFQFKMDVKRATTNLETGVTKMMLIKPKLSGVSYQALPPLMKADLEFLAKFKADNMLK